MDNYRETLQLLFELQTGNMSYDDIVELVCKTIPHYYKVSGSYSVCFKTNMQISNQFEEPLNVYSGNSKPFVSIYSNKDKSIVIENVKMRKQKDYKNDMFAAINKKYDNLTKWSYYPIEKDDDVWGKGWKAHYYDDFTLANSQVFIKTRDNDD